MHGRYLPVGNWEAGSTAPLPRLEPWRRRGAEPLKQRSSASRGVPAPAMSLVAGASGALVLPRLVTGEKSSRPAEVHECLSGFASDATAAAPAHGNRGCIPVAWLAAASAPAGLE